MENIDKNLLIKCSSLEEAYKVFDYLNGIGESTDRNYFDFCISWQFVGFYEHLKKWTLRRNIEPRCKNITAEDFFNSMSVFVPDYVEYIDTQYKGQIVKVEDWKCGSYCKVIFYDGQREQPFKHLVKPSTKEAYEVQQSKPNIEIGKFYSFSWEGLRESNRRVVCKVKSIDNDIIYISWRTYLWSGTISNNDAYNLSKMSDIKELSIEEVQQYLPDSHPDKIDSMRTILAQAKEMYPINTKFVPLYGEKKELTVSKNNHIVFKTNKIIVSTDKGNGGDVPNGAAIYGDGKWAEIISFPITVNEFKKGDYIVLNNDESTNFKKNYCYKQRQNSSSILPELDLSEKTTNGLYFLQYKSSLWRYATVEEIAEYNRLGKPYDVTDLSWIPKIGDWVTITQNTKDLGTTGIIEEYYNDDYYTVSNVTHKYFKNQMRLATQEEINHANLEPVNKLFPSNWCVKINDENSKTLDEWRKNQPYFSTRITTFKGWLVSNANDGTYTKWNVSIPYGYTEISFEEFKQNVLSKSQLSSELIKNSEAGYFISTNLNKQIPLIEPVHSVNVKLCTKKQINHLKF
jgi:hypothetical protein